MHSVLLLQRQLICSHGRSLASLKAGRPAQRGIGGFALGREDRGVIAALGTARVAGALSGYNRHS
jgi:hypothetical protein